MMMVICDDAANKTKANQNKTTTKTKTTKQNKNKNKNKTTTRTNCDCLLRPRLTHKNLRHHASGLVAAKELNPVPHVGYHLIQALGRNLSKDLSASCARRRLIFSQNASYKVPRNPSTPPCQQEKSPTTEAPVTADRSPYRRFHATTYASASRRSHPQPWCLP